MSVWGWIVYAALFVLFWFLFHRWGIFRRSSWISPVFLATVMGVLTAVNLVNGRDGRAMIFLALGIGVLVSWRIRERRA